MESRKIVLKCAVQEKRKNTPCGLDQEQTPFELKLMAEAEVQALWQDCASIPNSTRRSVSRRQLELSYSKFCKGLLECAEDNKNMRREVQALRQELTKLHQENLRLSSELNKATKLQQMTSADLQTLAHQSQDKEQVYQQLKYKEELLNFYVSAGSVSLENITLQIKELCRARWKIIQLERQLAAQQEHSAQLQSMLAQAEEEKRSHKCELYKGYVKRVTQDLLSSKKLVEETRLQYEARLFKKDCELQDLRGAGRTRSAFQFEKLIIALNQEHELELKSAREKITEQEAIIAVLERKVEKFREIEKVLSITMTNSEGKDLGEALSTELQGVDGKLDSALDSLRVVATVKQARDMADYFQYLLALRRKLKR